LATKQKNNNKESKTPGQKVAFFRETSLSGSNHNGCINWIFDAVCKNFGYLIKKGGSRGYEPPWGERHLDI